MRHTSPFSERTERVILAVIGADLLLQCVETLEAFSPASPFFFWVGVCIWLVYTIEWCVRIKLARAFRFAMDEAGALFAGIGVIGSACGIMADALREAGAGEPGR